MISAQSPERLGHIIERDFEHIAPVITRARSTIGSFVAPKITSNPIGLRYIDELVYSAKKKPIDEYDQLVGRETFGLVIMVTTLALAGRGVNLDLNSKATTPDVLASNAANYGMTYPRAWALIGRYKQDIDPWNAAPTVVSTIGLGLLSHIEEATLRARENALFEEIVAGYTPTQ